MTTIAYRDGVMAADTLLTTGHSNRDSFATKAFRFGSILVGIGGRMANAQAFVDWLRTGMKGDQPDLGGDQGAEILIVMPDDLILNVTHNGWARSRAPYMALGMGSDYASGAMAHGATAEQAVRAALAHEAFSGGPITVVRRPGNSSPSPHRSEP